MLVIHQQYVPVCTSEPSQEQILESKRIAKRQMWNRGTNRIKIRRYKEEPKFRNKTRYKAKIWYLWNVRLPLILSKMFPNDNVGEA